MLKDRGWTQEELALITGRSRTAISELVLDQTGITPEMAVALSSAFGNTPSDWMLLDADYKLSFVNHEGSADVEKRANIFKLAPIRDMQKRGWIADTKRLDELEGELKRFFATDDLNNPIEIPKVSLRGKPVLNLNAADRAWCFKAVDMASSILVSPFSRKKLGEAERKLRKLAAYPKEARHIPNLLNDYGIRFVIVEPLPGVKIDGAAFWLETDPVIAVSIRFDRIDGFWFTLMHEFAHVLYDDQFSVDNLLDSMKGLSLPSTDNAIERRANEWAAQALVPAAEMDSFIRRVGPLYSRERIIQFAHRIKIHPGIIVGQLQYRQEIGYASLREMLVKMRPIITSTALTDGWNQMVTPTLGGKNATATYS